ncbi:rhomboid-like protein [Lactococcus termiticola]|uniref:Uncharacterized protein n=1 Tax=Lactococcus termiticola TaxID=2169526 RepID=A0A2R5HKR5_9LACT|nr:rhomboid-like protein [Lactococcus termiticola]GBG97221.1 hypothetical protein NtB2_01359 [Lactococcus termiticola]
MTLVIILIFLALFWYLFRFAAHHIKKLRPILSFLEKYTSFLHRWVVSAPATFTYVAIFVAFTLVQRTSPDRLINVITRVNSTNIATLTIRPLSALITSSFWVADGGVGLTIYVLAFISLIAWAERTYGTARTIVIWIMGHVGGSLVTVAIELWAIRTGLAASTLAHTTDVGVSYVMAAGLAAAIWIMRGWHRPIAFLGMAILLISPFFFGQAIWEGGHLYAFLLGLATASISLKFIPGRPVKTPLEELQAGKQPCQSTKDQSESH